MEIPDLQYVNFDGILVNQVAAYLGHNTFIYQLADAWKWFKVLCY